MLSLSAITYLVITYLRSIHLNIKFSIMSTIVSYNKENTFIFKAISKAGDNVKTASLLEWLNRQHDLKLEDRSVFNDQEESFSEIKFRLIGQLTSYYPLLRSLSLFGINETIKLKADHSQRSFAFRYEESAAGEAKSYLVRLLGIIQKEARFKQVLGKLMENQLKFQQEEALLVTGLRH